MAGGGWAARWCVSSILGLAREEGEAGKGNARRGEARGMRRGVRVRGGGRCDEEEEEGGLLIVPDMNQA